MSTRLPPSDDLIDVLVNAFPYSDVPTGEDGYDFIRSLHVDGYVIIPGSAIGWLPPELVAKALAFTAAIDPAERMRINATFTKAEADALRAATFEVPT